MAVTPIPGAYLDNVGVEKLSGKVKQTSVGIGSFDGYAANQAALPTADASNNGKIYLVGDSSTPYTSNGSAWAAGGIILVTAIGALFYITNGDNLEQEGRFTTKPTYDSETAPTTATGGVCDLLSLGADRALTDDEVDEALASAGF